MLNVQRMEDFYDLLMNLNSRIPEIEFFDMGIFHLEEAYYSNTNRVIPLYDEEYNCGTAACALGSAALYPPFIKQGLCVDESTGDGVRFEEHLDFRAGAEFFGLQDWWIPGSYKRGDLEWLFWPDPDRVLTPQDIAERVLVITCQEGLFDAPANP